MRTRKRGNWSAHELDRLRALLPRDSVERVAELLRRSPASVRRRAAQLFAGPRVRGPWSEADERMLRVAYGAHDVADLALLLRRSKRDVEQRLRQLRRERRSSRWSAAEASLLRQLYGSRSNKDLEVSLSRPVAQIVQKAGELCLAKDKRLGVRRAAAGRASMPRWKAEEVRRLAALYPHHSNLDVARALRKSVASVANKASKLGLKKSLELLAATGRRNVGARYGR
jgi:hypothetical protein